MILTILIIERITLSSLTLAVVSIIQTVLVVTFLVAHTIFEQVRASNSLKSIELQVFIPESEKNIVSKCIFEQLLPRYIALQLGVRPLAES